MRREYAESLKEKLSSRLEGKKSYLKIVPISDGYELRLVVHPSEKEMVSEFPSVSSSPWEEKEGGGSAYVKQTPRTPSQNTDPFGFYPSAARRQVDGPSRSPDVNPAYPGLRRNPDLQDIVRRVAMRSDLKSRLRRIHSVLARMNSLNKLARAGHGYRNDSEHLVLELLAQLKSDGHTGRHKIVRLARKLQNALILDGYSFRKE